MILFSETESDQDQISWGLLLLRRWSASRSRSQPRGGVRGSGISDDIHNIQRQVSLDGFTTSSVYLNLPIIFFYPLL